MRAFRIVMVCLALFSLFAGGLAGCNAINGTRKDPTANVDDEGGSSKEKAADKAAGE